MLKLAAAVCLCLFTLPAFAQDVKQTIVKHVKVSAEFTLKVAEAMPADSYDFKLTPPQMSFAEQITHLAQAPDFFLGPFSTGKIAESKPASKSKADVIAFLKSSFEKAIQRVEAVTPKQLATTYKTEEGSLTGLELLLGMLDHTTHHRASAEMYLRAKGITPPQYRF
jgi:uncharacterized damage-inducible protein DinB